MSVQNPNWPLVAWQVCFDTDPNTVPTAYPVWDDITDRVVGYDVSRGRQYELGQIETGIANLKVRNADEALNPANTASIYNGGGAGSAAVKRVAPYRGIRHWAMWPLTGNILNDAQTVWAGASWNGPGSSSATSRTARPVRGRRSAAGPSRTPPCTPRAAPAACR